MQAAVLSERLSEHIGRRYHTAIGYYNTAYHHSTWFQTTTGRPFLFEFEDKGGPFLSITWGVPIWAHPVRRCGTSLT